VRDTERRRDLEKLATKKRVRKRGEDRSGVKKLTRKDVVREQPSWMKKSRGENGAPEVGASCWSDARKIGKS